MSDRENSNATTPWQLIGNRLRLRITINLPVY